MGKQKTNYSKESTEIIRKNIKVAEFRKSINNFELLHARNRFSKRLLDLPENTNEVLLQRQVRKSGARALHIFKNSNNNSKRSITVYFKNEKDYINSAKFAVYYSNIRLSQAKKKDKIVENEVIDVGKRKISYSKKYKRKCNQNT